MVSSQPLSLNKFARVSVAVPKGKTSALPIFVGDTLRGQGRGGRGGVWPPSDLEDDGPALDALEDGDRLVVAQAVEEVAVHRKDLVSWKGHFILSTELQRLRISKQFMYILVFKLLFVIWKQEDTRKIRIDLEQWSTVLSRLIFTTDLFASTACCEFGSSYLNETHKSPKSPDEIEFRAYSTSYAREKWVPLKLNGYKSCFLSDSNVVSFTERSDPKTHSTYAASVKPYCRWLTELGVIYGQLFYGHEQWQ